MTDNEVRMKLHEYIRICDPARLYNRLRLEVMGQDEQLKHISILLYAYLTQASHMEFRNKYHFMVIGRSGCGKSTFANALSRIFPIPVYILDGSSISPPGWKGCSMGDLMSGIMVTDEINEWQGVSICIIDEIDKMIQPIYGNNADNFNRCNQEALLKALDGGELYDKDGKRYDCSRMLFIGLGAFQQLRDELNKPERKAVGFSSTTEKTQKPKKDISRDALTEYCGSEQFMGRFAGIFEFSPLRFAEYERMLCAAVSEITTIFGGWELPKEVRWQILKDAVCSQYGGRYIRSACWNYFQANNNLYSDKELTL